MKRLEKADYEQAVEALNTFLDENRYELDNDTATAIQNAIDIVDWHTPEMAECYKIKQDIHIGDKRVVFGVNPEPTEGYPAYLVSFAETFYELGFTSYSDSIVSDDYLEAMKLFTERVNGQILSIEQERAQLGIPNEPMQQDSVIEGSHLEDYTGKVMVVRAEVLRHEYRNMAHQLVLAESGNGCSPKAIGSAVFTTTLATGKPQRFNRVDMLGELRPELVPEWAKAAAEKCKLKRKAASRGIRVSEEER